jgi:hypothetical protein
VIYPKVACAHILQKLFICTATNKILIHEGREGGVSRVDKSLQGTQVIKFSQKLRIQKMY